MRSTRRSTIKKIGHSTRAASRKRKVSKGMASSDWSMPNFIRMGARLMRKTAPKAKVRPLKRVRKLKVMTETALGDGRGHFFAIGHERFQHLGAATFGVDAQHRLRAPRAGEEPGGA